MNKNNTTKSLKIPKVSEKIARRVDSPIAKYDSNGNLFCIICKICIKTSSIWKVHVNSKVHKSNVEGAKKVDKTAFEKCLQSKTVQIEKSKPPLKLNKQNTNVITSSCSNKEKAVKENGNELTESTEVLPEMFFDDPVSDAKARHTEYKNTQNEEWERFQREMKEAESSNTLILGEQITNSALDKEITEISEQMHQWSKVIELENKLQNIVKREKSYSELEETDENMSDEDEVSDHLDWRCKKFI